MFTTPLLVALLSITAQSPAAPALVPVRGPATAATQEVAQGDGPIDAVPPTSKCSKDRRLAHTLRYATLPLNGSIGDSTASDALAEFLKRTPATAGVNALVIHFNLTGGEHAATLALAEQIVQVRRRMPVICVLGSCSGMGAILPIVCDYVVVLNPNNDVSVLEWTPASDVPNSGIAAEVGACFETIISRSTDRAYMRFFVNALLDPATDLFLWRGSDGCPEAAVTAPAGIPSVQLASGKDAMPGMTGSQLVASGLALSCTGSLDAVGKVLGVEKWIAQPDVAEKILAQIQERRSQEFDQLSLGLKTGFTAVKNARALVGGLIEAEANARATDPRQQKYRRTYSRNWTQTTSTTSTGSSWEFTRVGTSAWRKNVDFSIEAWQQVVRIFEEASAATGQARAIAATLAKNPMMTINPEFKAEVVALQSEVDALMAQAPALTVKGDNAKQLIAWLRNNYNNPAM